MKNIVAFPIRRKRHAQLARLRRRGETIWLAGFAIGLICGMLMAFASFKFVVMCSH
jgi:ABC-type cobalamin transport system permease subunit